MKLAVNLPQELVVDVGINLSGGNIGVPEQFLDHPQVGSVLEEVGGEGVAQEVRVDVLFDPGLVGAFLHNFPDPIGTEWSAAHGEEDLGGSVAPDELGALVGQIAFQGGTGPTTHRNNAGLVALAGDSEEAILEVQRLQAGGADFGEAQAGGVEEFQNGEVAATERPGGVDGFQQSYDLGFVKCLRQVTSSPGGKERLGGIVLDEAAAGKEAEEDLDMNHCDAEGGGLQALLLQLGEEFPERIDAKILPGGEFLLLGPVGECLQGASHGKLVSIRKPTLGGEVEDENVDLRSQHGHCSRNPGRGRAEKELLLPWIAAPASIGAREAEG